MAEQEGDFDADTRFAIAWFDQHGLGEGEFGDAETLSKAKNVGIEGLVAAGIVEMRPNRVRLLSRDELELDWNPAADRRLTAWEATQHLIHVLNHGGESAAAELLRRLGPLGDTARELAYRLFDICERKGWAQEALAYNSLVTAWPEIARQVAGTVEAVAQQKLEV